MTTATLTTVPLSSIDPRTVNDRPVILTAGGHMHGTQLVGVFETAGDARSIDADDLAIQITSMERLTPEQREIAERNSDNL